MNLKYNIRLQQSNPYNDRMLLNSPLKVMTPKRNRALEDQENLKRIIAEFSRPCSRCFSEQACLSCYQCRNELLCSNCDIKLHLKGKFSMHQRDSLKQTSLQGKIKQKPEPNANKQNKQFQSQLKKSTNLNINQLWDAISSQISQKFRVLSDSIKDKKKQILDKIEKRREQEIRQLQILYNNPESESAIGGRQNLCNLNYGLHPGFKLQSLGNQQFDFKCERKYKTSLGIFQQIESLVQKIQMKNILIKNIEELQPTAKKPMKRSMVFLSPSGNSNLSPHTKTPAHTKSQLSQSTVEVSPMELAFKLTQEAKKRLQIEKQSKMLTKVRSQKLFCKSPTGGSQKYLIKQKTIVKKGFKQGQ